MVTIVPGRGLITTTPADRAIHPADQRDAIGARSRRARNRSPSALDTPAGRTLEPPALAQGAQLLAGGLTRWHPFAGIAELRSRFDRVFDEPGGQPQDAWRPWIEVMRRDDTLVVCADLPGLTPDEVKIEVEDGVLTVSGEPEEDRSDSDGGRYVRRERRFGAFSRSIELPSGVDAYRSRRRCAMAWSSS
jgi:HSP20 family protein